MIHNWDNFRLYRGQIPSADEFREILMSDPIMGTILTYFLKDGMSPKGRFWYRTSIPISRGPLRLWSPETWGRISQSLVCCAAGLDALTKSGKIYGAPSY